MRPSNPRSEHIGSGEVQVVTDLDRVNIAYDQSRLDSLLLLYALSHHEDPGLADDIEDALGRYGQAVSAVATTDAGIDVNTVRGAFDKFYEGMDKAAAAKFGPERPRTMTALILTKLGLREPTYRKYFSRLDDRYWNIQFMEQYKDQSWVKREPDESEQSYAGRYIAATLHRFPWPYFSFI